MFRRNQRDLTKFFGTEIFSIEFVIFNIGYHLLGDF